MKIWEVIVIGGGCAGLSAAIYLSRAKRKVLVIDTGKSLARWEPDVQNYMGFPSGISGEELLQRAVQQARRYGADFERDEIVRGKRQRGGFVLRGKKRPYHAHCVLLATGLLHLPPKIPQVKHCLGTSMFFCKDCDGFRCIGKKVVIVGNNDEAVEYALSLFSYASCVFIATNGQRPGWSRRHAGWIRKYKVPLRASRIVAVEHSRGHLKCLFFENDESIEVEALFTTRGDVIHNKVAKSLGAKLDSMDQVKVDRLMRTSVKGLYAAGCVTPANCQMIIAAGDGAKAAQAINRDLFKESLRQHTLDRLRDQQIATKKTKPVLRR